MEHLEEAGSTPAIQRASSPPRTSRRRSSRRSKSKPGRWPRTWHRGMLQHSVRHPRRHVVRPRSQPPASRTVPFVAKSSGLPLARIAANVTIGQPCQAGHPQAGHRPRLRQGSRVPLHQAPGPRPAPGPGMKSTGEVFGSDEDPAMAYLKARGHRSPVANGGGVYLTVRDEDKPTSSTLLGTWSIGYELYATPGRPTASVAQAFLSRPSTGSPNLNTPMRWTSCGGPRAVHRQHPDGQRWCGSRREHDAQACG